MARLHLRFRNIHKGAKAAGERLFVAKPWVGSDEEKQSKFERFLNEASAAYGVPTPTLAVAPEVEVNGLVAPNTIVITKYSVVSLFNSFRQHLQYTGAVDVEFPNKRDAQAWACSLFYTLRPIPFRKAVRAGGVMGVYPNDLLTSATLAARQDEIDEAFAGIMGESYSQDEIDDLEDEAADGLPDEMTDEQAASDDTPSLVPTEVAATRLSVSTSTIRNMCNDGRLSCTMVGRKRLVSEDSINALLASQGGSDE